MLRRLCASVCIGKKHSMETKEKVRKSLAGRTRPKEHCESISRGKLGRPGRPHSEESRMKMSEIRYKWWEDRRKVTKTKGVTSA